MNKFNGLVFTGAALIAPLTACSGDNPHIGVPNEGKAAEIDSRTEIKGGMPDCVAVDAQNLSVQDTLIFADPNIMDPDEYYDMVSAQDTDVKYMVAAALCDIDLDPEDPRTDYNNPNIDPIQVTLNGTTEILYPDGTVEKLKFTDEVCAISGILGVIDPNNEEFFAEKDGTKTFVEVAC